MYTYYMKNVENEYWSANGRFGYWNKFTDIQSIKQRVKYCYINAKVQLFLMKLLGNVEATMEKVEPEFIKDKK